MKVEIVYALPDQHWSVVLELADAATVADALRRCSVLGALPEAAGAGLKVSVFGRIVAAEHRLRDGDRVEVLRPLQADPKEARRRLAAQGRTMGRRRLD